MPFTTLCDWGSLLALRMRLGVADPACLARLRPIAPIVVRLGLTTVRNSQILARLRLRERFKPWCDWGSGRRDGIARLRLNLRATEAHLTHSLARLRLNSVTPSCD